jgi:hypothetical protein
MHKSHIILLFFLVTTSVLCQEKDTTYKYWMTFSLGGWPTERVVVPHSAYSFSYHNKYYKIAYFSWGRDWPFEPPLSALPNSYILRSLSVSIGKRYRSNWFEASGFIGPSFVYGKKGLYYDSNHNAIDKKVYSPGIEAEVQFLFRPAKEVGMGVGFYADMNFLKNFAGAMVTLTLGNGK